MADDIRFILIDEPIKEHSNVNTNSITLNEFMGAYLGDNNKLSYNEQLLLETVEKALFTYVGLRSGFKSLSSVHMIKNLEGGLVLLMTAIVHVQPGFSGLLALVMGMQNLEVADGGIQYNIV